MTYMAALFIIGSIQILGLLVRLLTYKNRHPSYVRNLRNYGYGVLVYFIILWILTVSFADYFDDAVAIIYLGLIPSCMAIYYWYMVYRDYGAFDSEAHAADLYEDD